MKLAQDAADEPLDDETLMLKVCRGDRTAFRTLSLRFAQRLTRFCARQVNDETLGEDFAQDVLVAAWVSREQFRGGNTAAWLFTLAVNRCRRHQRGFLRLLRFQRHSAAGENEGVTGHDEQHLAIEHRQLLERARQALDQLSPHLRETLLLRFDGELDYRAIGMAVGCSEGAARVRVFDAIRRLRAALEEEPQ